MSSLYLIRHGQASYGAANYDVLSEHGAAQSARLGEYVARKPLRFDAVYCGPRKRQRDTATHMIEAARRHNGDVPEPIELADFDEYPAFELIEYFMPRMLAEDPEVKQRLSRSADSKTMDWATNRLLTRWATGELVCDELETFAAFETRVIRGLRHVMKTEGRGRTVAVVTSGGPISIAMKHTLELPAHQIMRLGWTIVNSSWSRFRYRGDELSLHTFNAIGHLDDDAVTYR